jgi:ankyrin repeat protein
MRRMTSVDAFLHAVAAGDAERAEELAARGPELAATSLHAAAVLGLVGEVRRLLEQDRSQLSAQAGDPPAEPLVWLCYSPFHGERDEGLEGAARALLEAGADPNARDGGEYRLPALYAVTGRNHAPRIARLLLEAGAEPTDGESVFHAAERFHEEALELLLAYGVDLNANGDWGNTPLYFLLRYWDIADGPPELGRGLRWLLDHGADPNVVCGREQENSLHVATRRGQDPEVVRLLLTHGADVHARRLDGRSAWLLARRGGHDALAELLEAAGAAREHLAPTDLMMEACGRGDADAARRLAAPVEPEDARVMPEAAGRGRFDVVRACLAAAFPVDTPDEFGATALHHAAIHGHAETVLALLAAGADTTIRDAQHDSDTLGWARYGLQTGIEPDGDYEASIRALTSDDD